MADNRSSTSPAAPGGIRTAALGAGVLALAAVTIALGSRFVFADTIVWAEMSSLMLAGTVCLALAVFAHSVLTGSLGGAIRLLAAATVIGAAVEHAGVSADFFLGLSYHYHPDLDPKLFGTVPVFIPLAWYALAYAPVVYLRGFATGGRAGRTALKVVLAALLLTAIDLFLDPLAISTQAWSWPDGGAYLGVPLLNFAGWFIVGVAIFACIYPFETERTPARTTAVLDAAFVIGGTVLLVLAHIAIVRRLDTLLPVLVTLVTLGPFTVFWVRQTRRALARP